MTYPIPNEALDDRLGFVGTSGSGKTYNAGTAVERLLHAKARVVILDALDVWWGLRSDADGARASKFNLPIFGGPHGDLPLNEHAGALIGETVAGMAESCIVSLKGLPSDAAARRFVLAFLKTLYAKHRGGLFHLVIDEADLWVPQVVMDRDGDAVKLKGLVSNIVRRGRVDGFIPWLITQRPAVIAKDVLSQVDGLISFKLTSSQDRDALGAWIDGQADRETGKEIQASLPTLPVGTGVVWLPGRGILATAAFPEKVTFDSSRAPKRGEVARAATLKPLDLGALKERLATVEADTKANDPKVLKAEIAALKKELAARPDPAKTYDVESVEAAERAGRAAGLAEGEARGVVRGQGVMLARCQAALNAVRVDEAAEAASPAPAAPRPASAPARPNPPPRPAPTPRPAVQGDAGEVPPGCAKPLGALAAVYPSGLTEAQWATAAGYKRSGGTWGTYKSRLRGAGLIEAREGRWFATETGAQSAGDVELPPSPGPDLVRWWAAKLPGVTKIAEALIEAWPEALTRDDLAARVDMSASGGSFGTYLSRLAGPGLIEREGGVVRLSTEAMGS